MGVDIASWRARIGSFHGGRLLVNFTCVSYDTSGVQLFFGLVIYLLLLASGLESNPGPQTKSKKSCCVPDCALYKIGKVTFHELPIIPKQRQDWLTAISREGDTKGSAWSPHAHATVCSKHFAPQDFRENVSKVLLKPGAIPSIFNYPAHKQPKRPIGDTERPRFFKRKKEDFGILSAKRYRKKEDPGSRELQGDPPQLEPIVHDVHAAEPQDHGLRAALNQPEANLLHAQSGAAPLARANDPKTAEKGINVDTCRSKLLVRVMRLKADKRKMIKAMRNLRSANSKQRSIICDLKEDLKELDPARKDHDLVNKVREGVEAEDIHSIYLLDLLKNVLRKRPSWSEPVIRNCIMWRSASSTGYETGRGLGILHAPCKSTLDNYMSDLKSGPGLSPLTKARLVAERKNLSNTIGENVSLEIDETHMNGGLVYNTTTGEYEGFSDVPGRSSVVGKEADIATKLLCFIITGLNIKFSIIASYFFVDKTTAEELHTLTLKVLQDLEEIGWRVIRINTDNATINQKMFRMLSGGSKIKPEIPHPLDPERSLFLSYDYVHVLKNLNVQQLTRLMQDTTGRIIPDFIQGVYEVQIPMLFKGAQGVYRSHFAPKGKEKMKVGRAVRIYKPDFIASLEIFKEMCHTVRLSIGKIVDFSDAGPTIRFMKFVRKFWVLHDITECSQSFRQRDPDRAAFRDSDDPRLTWLEEEVPNYVKEIQKESRAAGLAGLTAETADALVLTSKSTALCIRYLLKTLEFSYVLPSKFSNDNIEGSFGVMKNKGGDSNSLTFQSANSSVRNIQRSGLMLIKKSSNVSAPRLNESSAPLQHDQGPPQNETHPELPTDVQEDIERLKAPDMQVPLTIANIMRAWIAGYLVSRVKKTSGHCPECLQSIERPKSSAPIYARIYKVDGGSLCYPALQLINALHLMQNVATAVIPLSKKKTNMRKMFSDIFLSSLEQSNMFTCERPGHKEKLVKKLLLHYLPPLLKGYAVVVHNHHV